MTMPHVVYRAFDAEGSLLYVGCTSSLTKRSDQHARGSAWWPYMARIEHRAYATYAQARFAETLAIRTESPLFNLRGRDVPEPRAREAAAAYTGSAAAPQSTGEDALSPVEVAAEWGVDRSTVKRLIDRGQLPAWRNGRVVRIKRTDADAFVARHRVTAR